MVKTLIIGDIHISNKDARLRDAQEKCIKKIYDTEKPDEVIQLGDFLDFRKPSPEAMITAKNIIDHWKKESNVYILRGNHCASTKADDGVTAMSLFEGAPNQKLLPYVRDRVQAVKIITHTWFDHRTKRAFIPHYENEETIIQALERVPRDYTVFGHFGYFGCLNSVGDHDFDININSFRNDTILGHIHRKNERTFKSNGQEKSLLILGTPYTTNFGESGKQNYYATISKGELKLHEIDHGPRHMMILNKDLPDCIDDINNDSYHTYLRVVLDAGEPLNDIEGICAASIDVKYAPAFDEEDVSTYRPRRDLFKVNEMVIEDYIKSANSCIEKDKLMDGYNLLRYED